MTTRFQITVAGALRTFLCVMFPVLFLTSCFTGVESTPKIGNTELKKRNVITTPEQLYIADITPQKFADWQPGKTFEVTDAKIAMIFNQGVALPSFSKGDILEFVGKRESVSPTGSAVDLYFHKRYDDIDREMVYRIATPMEELIERGEVEIPFTVELSVSDNVRQRLIGQTYYIITPRWLDTNEAYVTRLKYIPVKVVDVESGNFDFPVRVIFKPDDILFKDDELYSVYMSVGSGPRSTRNFETLFSLKNPREKYSWITDENWRKIIENRLAVGMTRDEARLAVGSPNDIDRGHDYSSTYERWIYDGGMYLIFQDGILQSYRR